MTILNLGRIGDNINLLPVLYSEHLAGRRATIVTSEKYSEIFDGVSYCDVRRYSGDPLELAHATSICRQLPDLRVAQVFMNPDQGHQESSFAIEGYRLGMFRDRWRKFPFRIDNRNTEREQKLIENIDQPFIAVAPTGVSSPFANSKQLIEGLQDRFRDYKIVDLSQIKAEKFYDLLGILDAASCLVTIDTAHLWLSNVSICPVVTLVNNGWRGSPPPVTSVASFSYKNFQIDQVCDAVESCLLGTGDTWAIVDRFGKEKRHREAFKSQEKVFGNLLDASSIERTAQSIGDSRPLPMLKEMLKKALKFSSNRDIIIWTNDDVHILDLAPVVSHCARFGVCGVRRDAQHMGRELFAFRWDWLADRIYNFPDCAVAAPWFDLAVAAWIRKQFGWVSTMDNFIEDRYPAEIPNNGILHHPDHPSSWVGEKENYPAARWNHRIFRSFIQ